MTTTVRLINILAPRIATICVCVMRASEIYS